MRRNDVDKSMIYEIVYRDGELDRMMRPTGKPLATVTASTPEDAVKLFWTQHMRVAGFDVMAVGVHGSAA